MLKTPSSPIESPALGSDLLNRAASLLTAEATRMQGAAFGDPLGRPLKGPVLDSGLATPDLMALGLTATHVDDLRRRGSELLEALLAALTPRKGAATSADDDDRVPLLRAVAPAQAGTPACALIRITNEETTASSVSLYSSNFISDSGYELPSLLVSFTPRSATVEPGAVATFEAKVAVPAQTPRGQYSGLIQAAGCKYVKAVITFEVL